MPSFDAGSLLSGKDEDYGYGVAVDRVGDVIATGGTRSNNLPAVALIQGANAGRVYVFVTRIGAGGAPIL